MADKPSSLHEWKIVTQNTRQVQQTGKDEPDVRDCKAQDECPNHAEDELQVPVDNVCTHVRGKYSRRKLEY